MKKYEANPNTELRHGSGVEKESKSVNHVKPNLQGAVPGPALRESIIRLAAAAKQSVR